MELVFREIQTKVNECVRDDLKSLEKNFGIKLQYFTKEQKLSFLNLELFRVADELALLRRNNVIESVFEYVDNPDFIWESTFIESLTSDEKKKYRNFDLSLFDLNLYISCNEHYDEKLPYFSQIIKFVVLSQYMTILKTKLSFYQTINQPNKDEKPKIMKKTFESNFNEKQIEILTRCINESRIFTELITTEIVRQIFNCELDSPLRVKNNRLLAYFLVSLDDRSLITHSWHAVCESNQLFLSSFKGKILTQSDLSTATNECRDKPPKDSEIIDKYLKELKKH